MGTISGKVLFNINGSAKSADPLNKGIKNIPVVLQVIGSVNAFGSTTALGIGALTNSSGEFTFTDVPIGQYRVIEAWGYSGAQSDTVSFSTAETITVTPKDPPISATGNTSFPATYRLNSLSPNTEFVLIIKEDEALNSINFLDAPVNILPLELNNFVTIGENLIKLGDKGQFGTLPNGSNVMTSPPVAPYPDIVTVFQYEQYGTNIPLDGEYSITNTITNNNFNVWFNMSDYTQGDETGRMQVINGSFPGQSFFSETVTVKQNTNYVFSTWICNVDSDPIQVLPELRVKIINGNNTIFNQNLSNTLNPTQYPTWNQVGTTFNSANNSEVKVSFISEGGAATGNDFIIDQVTLYELEQAPVTELKKVVDKTIAVPGQTLTYSCIFTNKGPSTITKVIFKDSIPANITLIPSSILVNKVKPTSGNLQEGIDLGTIAVGEEVLIEFQGVVNSNVTNGTIIKNTGVIEYSFIDAFGQERNIKTNSNEVSTTIIENKCKICPPGPEGPQGPIGIEGAIGPQGPTGPRGIAGVKGVQGTKGEQGQIGPQGKMGEMGEIGLSGPEGITGPMGETGPPGLAGVPGKSGEEGPPGPNGIPGPQGLQGATGKIGPKGEPGEVGAPGPIGPVGIQGPRGENGIQGKEGPIGDIGAEGTQGNIGLTGERGKQGEVGLKGPTGDRGLSGIPGIKGPTGAEGPRGPKGKSYYANSGEFGQYIIEKEDILCSQDKITILSLISSKGLTAFDNKNIYLNEEYAYLVKWKVKFSCNNLSTIEIGIFQNQEFLEYTASKVICKRINKITSLEGFSIITPRGVKTAINLGIKGFNCNNIMILGGLIELHAVGFDEGYRQR